MTTDIKDVELRGGGPAHVAVYGALLRADQREPEDFVFMRGDVDFIMTQQPRALAIVEPSESHSGALVMRRAALGQGVELRIVDEADAVVRAGEAASWLIGEV